MPCTTVTVSEAGGGGEGAGKRRKCQFFKKWNDRTARCEWDKEKLVMAGVGVVVLAMLLRR